MTFGYEHNPRKKSKRSAESADLSVLLETSSWEERLDTVRGYYTGFGERAYPRNKVSSWSRAKKDKLRRHYKAIRPFLGAPLVRIKPKTKAQVKAAWLFLFGIDPPLDTPYVPLLESPVNEPEIIYRKGSMPDLEPKAMLDAVRKAYPGKFTSKQGYDWRRASDWPDSFFTKIENAYQKLAPPVEVVRVALKGGVDVDIHYFEDWGFTEKRMAIMDKETDEQLLNRLKMLDSNSIAIMTGNYYMGVGGKNGMRDYLFLGSPEMVLRQIRNLQNRYANWGDWLRGVKAYSFNKGKDTQSRLEFNLQIAADRKAHLQSRKRLQKLNRNIYRLQDKVIEIEKSVGESRSILKEAQAEVDFYNKVNKTMDHPQVRGYRAQRIKLRDKYYRELKKEEERLRRSTNTLNKAIRERSELIKKMTARKLRMSTKDK